MNTFKYCLIYIRQFYDDAGALCREIKPHRINKTLLSGGGI